MDDKGNIRRLDEGEYQKMTQTYAEELNNRLRHTAVPITEDEARFFYTKGMAFRQLWAKRFMRGLTVNQRSSLDEMIKAWKNE